MLKRKIQKTIQDYFQSKSNKVLLLDDYDTLSAMPIEVKSGKDFKKHTALDKFVQNEDYHIKKAILFSNNRDVQRKGKVLYLPIYYVMFL